MKGKKVLIVSEDTLTAKMLHQALNAEGHRTKHLARPKLFINDIENICEDKATSDIIIFDLPQAVGYSPLCRAFHENPHRKKTLLITLSTMRSECGDCALCSADNSECLLKPFRIADIVNEINNHRA